MIRTHDVNYKWTVADRVTDKQCQDCVYAVKSTVFNRRPIGCKILNIDVKPQAHCDRYEKANKGGIVENREFHEALGLQVK